jgi:uncharacterized membrane protein YGL010W
MKSVDQWLAEYGESHQDRNNKVLHWICVPIIVVSLVGLLASLPVPEVFRELSARVGWPVANWGTLLIVLGVLYYFVMSRSLAIGMLLFSALVSAIVALLDRLPVSLWVTCLSLFVVAWIGQFIGHHYEGKRPSFFKDIQFLMIGPLWLLSFIYRRLGIPY